MRWGDGNALWGAIVIGAAAVALWWGVRARRRAERRLGDAAVLAPLLAEVSLRRRRLRLGLRALALVLLWLALLRPQWGSHSELARHRGLDVVFAIDVSRSMRARDVRPDRLRRAKMEIARLADQLDGDRIGLIAFAGTAFVQCPLTTDVSALRMFLKALNPDVVPQGGTALARALRVAERLFADSAAKAEGSVKQAQVLVLLTDGEDHEGEVEAAAAALKEQGVHIFAVGVGSQEGEPVPLLDDKGQVEGYLKDSQGHPVLSRLSTTTLQSLVDASDGTLLTGLAVDANLLQVAREIDKLQKAEFDSRLTVQYRERFVWPLSLALLALLAGEGIRPRRRREVDS